MCFSVTACLYFWYQVEQNYREKLQQLSKKEQEMIQRLQRREEVKHSPTPSPLKTDTQELEASLYSQRQLVLQELELIRQREDHLAKQSELTKLQSSDIHSTSERLKQEEQILRR